ncbi:MAG: tetratricopeptide repeat protein [Myxococcota bacterium]
MAEQTDRRSHDLAQQIDALEEQFKQAPERNASALAEAYLDYGRPREAIRVLEKFTNGKDVERNVLLAQAWFDSFNNSRSAKLLKVAAKAGSLDTMSRAQVLLGELAFEDGRSEEAKKHLQQARSLDPKNRRAAQLLQNLGEAVEIPEGVEPLDGPVGFRTAEVGTETASRAMTHIIVGFVACVALLGVYYWWSQNAYEAKKLAVEGAQMVESADVQSLRNAEIKFIAAREYQSGNEYAIAGLAEAYTLLWVDHGFDDYKAKAAELVELAREKNIEKAERFAAEVLYAYGEGKFAEAEQTAAAVIEKGGVSEKLYWTLGMCQRAMGKIKLGRDNLRRAYDLKGDAPHYATALGDAYDEDNDDRNATFFWKLAADRNSSYVPGVARSLMARVRKGADPKQLEDDLAALDEIEPKNIGKRDRAAIELARSALLTRLGKGKQSVAAAKKAADAIGETPRLLMTRGIALIADGKSNAGLKDLEAAHKKAPGLERYLYGLATALIDAGKHDKAIQTLKVGGGKLTQEPFYHARLGDAFRAKKNWKKAIESYDKALNLHEVYPAALLGRGIVAWRQKKYDDATSWLEKAIGARSSYPEVYVAVGLMWVERGYTKEAHTQLDMAEKLFIARGQDSRRMKEFYGSIIKAYGRAKRASSYVRQWAGREAAYRKGT